MSHSGGARREEEDDTAAMEEAISNDLMRIHRESYGRSAARARTYILGDDVVCFMDDIELLPNEQFLIESGEGEAVVNVRSKFQHAIEATFTAAVERATGRKVIAFASHTELNPNFAVEIFRLEPDHGRSKEPPEFG
jgi:uncharacterized protein YbcI